MADYQEPEFARGIRIPFQPDRVLSPDVIYRGTRPSCIYYVTAEDEPIRVTFEGLDAIKGCRGKYRPYPEQHGHDQSTHEGMLTSEQARALVEPYIREVS